MQGYFVVLFELYSNLALACFERSLSSGTNVQLCILKQQIVIWQAKVQALGTYKSKIVQRYVFHKIKGTWHPDPINPKQRTTLSCTMDRLKSLNLKSLQCLLVSTSSVCCHKQ